MLNFETFGCTPVDEDCQQVGMPDYDGQMAFRECRAFQNQIVRTFGEPPVGATVRIKTFPHDFGAYMEVCGIYEEENIDAFNYVMVIEGALPERWDAEAKAELNL